MDFVKTNEAITSELTEEENATLEKFMEITMRMQILQHFRNSMDSTYNPLAALDEILDSKGIPDKDAFIPINQTISVTTACLDKWIDELKAEHKALTEQVVVFMYRISLKDYANELKNSLQTKVISPNIPKYVTKYFLTDKFGEGDSPAKDAMSDICTEAVNYFIASMSSGVFEKVMDDMKE